MVTLVFLAANPRDTSRLAQDREWRAIVDSVASSQAIEAHACWAVTSKDVIAQLGERAPHIAHISSHADAGGALRLASRSDNSHRMSPERLGAVFERFKGNLQLAVLSGCDTQVAAKHVVAHVDCVVATVGNVKDDIAVQFASPFYGALARNQTVQHAFDAAQLAVNSDSYNLFEREPGIAETARVDVWRSQTPPSASALRLRWETELPEDGNLYNALSWHYQLAPLIGRDDELRELLDWVQDDRRGARLHWLHGAGGVGKTRLAAELCQRLRERGWDAGFVDWDAPFVVPEGERVCMVFDYPEEHRAAMLSALRALAGQGPRIRALALSRHDIERWEDDLKDANVWRLCDATFVRELQPLAAGECAALFAHVSQRYADAYDLATPSVSVQAVADWRALNPTTHGRPLFVTAAAVHAVLAPEAELGIRGGAIIEALVDREIARLDRLGVAHGMERGAGSRVCGLAVITGVLDVRDVRRLAEPALGLGLPPVHRAVAAVAALPHWRDGALRPPAPHVMAAALLQAILDRQPDDVLAAEWLWAVLDSVFPRPTPEVMEVEKGLQAILDQLPDDVLEGCERKTLLNWLRQLCFDIYSLSGGTGDLDCEIKTLLERLGRVCFDIDSLAGDTRRLGRVGLNHRFAAVIGDRPERAQVLRAITWESYLPVGLEWMAVAVGQALVAEHRRRAEDYPTFFLPGLAWSLNNLSHHLSDVGRSSEALEASEEAVKLRRKLAGNNPAQFLPHLAISLGTLSNGLRAVGRNERALMTMQEAVEIFRNLPADKRGRFLPDLAMCLNNLSVFLRDAGRSSEELEACEEAAVIHRKLARDNPARFLPDLATSLYNLSGRLMGAGRSSEALEAIEEAAEIRRDLARRNPARFTRDLLMALNTLADFHGALGNEDAARAARAEAVGIQAQQS